MSLNRAENESIIKYPRKKAFISRVVASSPRGMNFSVVVVWQSQGSRMAATQNLCHLGCQLISFFIISANFDLKPFCLPQITFIISTFPRHIFVFNKFSKKNMQKRRKTIT